jgi:maltose O-acetyltransferase
MITLKKLKKYGIRRAFVYFAVVVICHARGFFYKFIISDNSPSVEDSRVLQPTQFVGKGKIKIIGAKLGVWPSPSLFGSAGYIEARSSDAVIEINKSTFINNSFVIIADKKEIKIGERCLIGPNFFVTDSDFHGLELENRCNGNYECAGVVIEDDVFIGDNVRILKGVKVGRGAVIGSGSVVVSDVESMAN